MHQRNNFDGIRLLAAFAVLVSHQFLLVGRAQPRTIGSMTLGGTAVLVFFVISGYLVASSWARDPEAWRFLARRLLRIWPAYAAVVVLTAVWRVHVDDRAITPYASWVYSYKNLAFITFDWEFFPSHREGRLNGSLWTIPYEVGCYVGLMLAATVLRRYWAVAAAVVVGAVVLARFHGQAVVDASALTGSSLWVIFGGGFCFGAVLFGLPALRTPRATAAIVVVGVIAFATGWQLIGVLGVLSSATIGVGLQSWPGLRDVGRFGDFSYGVYLWAWPIQQLVIDLLGPDASLAANLAVSCVLVAGAAIASWHLIEKRALRAKPSPETAWPERLKLQLR